METASSATGSITQGKPTEPMPQGLPKILPLRYIILFINKIMEKENQNLSVSDDGQYDVVEEMSDRPKPQKSKIKKKKKSRKTWMWPIVAFFVTLGLSALFSLASNFIISVSGLIIVIVVIVFLLLVSILFDGIGVAFASCDPTPFYSLASKKIRGAKMSLSLLKVADRVSSVCNDIIGDICGIVSGACGASIIIKLALQGTAAELWISVLVGALISALTVSGKAIAKGFSMKHAHGIVSGVGKILSVFSGTK